MASVSAFGDGKRGGASRRRVRGVHRRWVAGVRARRMRLEWLEDRRLLSLTPGGDDEPVLGAETVRSPAWIAESQAVPANGLQNAGLPPFVPGEILIGFDGQVPALYRSQGAASAPEAAGKLVAPHGVHSPDVLLDVPATDNPPLIWRLAGASRRGRCGGDGPAFRTPARYRLRGTQLSGLHRCHPERSATVGVVGPAQHGPDRRCDRRRHRCLGSLERGAGSLKVVTGVVDTGVDYTHPDLYRNVWINQGEIPTSIRSKLKDVEQDGLITFSDLNARNGGVLINGSYVTDLNANGYIDGKDLLSDSRWVDGSDNDRSGYKDDLLGWDFFNGDNDPLDDNNHGTHVSGTIGAMGNSGAGVVGVNWNVQIMGLKFLSSGGSGDIANAAKAIDYATKMPGKGVNVVLTSHSWGTAAGSQTLYSAIQKNGNAGMLLVASAGNNYANADINPSYPAAYDLPNIISVAATDHNDAKADFSNWGTSVDLAAPRGQCPEYHAEWHVRIL